MCLEREHTGSMYLYIYALCVKNVGNIFIFYYYIMIGFIYVMQCTFTLINSYLSAFCVINNTCIWVLSKYELYFKVECETSCPVLERSIQEDFSLNAVGKGAVHKHVL